VINRKKFKSYLGLDIIAPCLFEPDALLADDDVYHQPPTRAFWSATLYDSANGFFMPNDRTKYSDGENAGMLLDDQGGIAVYLAEDQPDGVPDESWLPPLPKNTSVPFVGPAFLPGAL